MLMSIFDQLSLFFRFSGLPEIGSNCYFLILLLVASLLIRGLLYHLLDK